jgi:diguanylate cyclase (GGDEF)-like protein
MPSHRMSQVIAAKIQAQLEQGAVNEAIVEARRALAQATGDDRGHVLLALANACNTAGQHLEALRAAVAANDAFKASDNRTGMCSALIRVGASLRSAGDHASAITTFEQAEELAREIGDELRIAQVLRNVGICCSIVGRHRQALTCLNEAQALHQQQGDLTESITSRLSLYNALSRQAESLPGSEEARRASHRELLGPWLALADEAAASGRSRLAVMARGNYAITLHQSGRHAEAVIELQALLERYQAFGMRPNVAITLNQLGRCHEALHDAAAARDHYLQAIEVLGPDGSLDDLHDAYDGLSDAEEALGDHRGALAALRKAREMEARKSDAEARSSVARRELRIELARLTSQWARQAVQDPLTGLGNRRALDRWMAEALPRVEQGEPLTLLLLDLDHFKQVNDRFGHGIGDEVLCTVARLIQHNCRSRDLAVRYGGEEFVLALASVGPADAVEIAERLRESVRAHPWGAVHEGLAVTVSIGVAEAVETLDAVSLLTLADRRLYAAKYAGRDQVVSKG